LGIDVSLIVMLKFRGHSLGRLKTTSRSPTPSHAPHTLSHIETFIQSFKEGKTKY